VGKKRSDIICGQTEKTTNNQSG